jgi:hypothetical protein
VRLAAELDEAQLYQAAAYASMVVDAIDQRSAGTDDNNMQTVELDFEVDEHGRVWMIRKGDCYIIGRKTEVCSEMRRFLATIAEAGS